MEESTTLCTNCQRPIAASNYVIHSLHCQRNLTKCEKCGETVPRSGMEEHDFEFHSKVSCPDCQVMVEKPQLDAHKKTTCRSRQQGCRYCELELPASEICEHENYCGSRTKLCDDCGEYVMLKYEQLHLDSNHGFLKLDDEPGPTATWIKNDIESGSFRAIKSNNNKKPQLSTGKFDNVDDDDSDSMNNLFARLMKNKRPVGTNSHYPGVAYPVSSGPQRTVSRSPPPYQDVQNDTSDLVALPCEFCEAMIPVNQLLIHQTGCRPDITSVARIKNPINESKKIKNNSDRFVAEEDAPLNVEERNNSSETVSDVLFDQKNARKKQVFSSDYMRRNAIDRGNEGFLKNDIDDDGTVLPCEFCGEGYPPSLLLEHQDVCDLHPRNFQDVTPVWTGSQDFSVGRSDAHMNSSAARTWKFDDSSHNTFVDSDQTFTSSSRGKSNLSNSYNNDLHGNFTVASEWSDDSDSRPTSATGAIPKQKAGKLNITRKINQEIPSSRSTNSVVATHTRVAPDVGAVSSSSDYSPRFRIRNNLKEPDDEDES